MKKILYDIFHTRWDHGGSIWLYSDPHFNDEEMKYLRSNYIGDDEQIKRINSKIGKNDTIIFLGDIGDVNCIKHIRGYKVLIMGNHDAGVSNYKRKVVFPNDCEWEIGIDNHLFDEVYEGPLMINNRILLSHEPIDIPLFMFNIHGHDHSNRHTGINFLNICAEHINYTPVCLNTLIKNGLLKNTPSIHRYTIDNVVLKKEKKNT